MPATVLQITDGVLRLADDEAGLTTGEAVQEQVTQATINANANLQTVPATFTQPETQVAAPTRYELQVNWLQDWTKPGGGLSGWAFANDTEEKWFELKLDDADTEPVARGVLRIVAGGFAGAAATPLQASVTWPIQGRPTITVPAA
jgi:hypothetical protein